MNPYKKSLIYLHLGTFLCALSGIFGKLLALPSLIITLGRVFFSSLALLLILLAGRKRIRLDGKKDFFSLAALGVLLAVHWASFYEAIQLSTVALGLLAFSTFPVFVTFLEPLFFRQKLRLENVVIALAVFAGIAKHIPSISSSVVFAFTTPINCPRILKSPPPELPGLIAVSVCKSVIA